jgi:hypothetical protein
MEGLTQNNPLNKERRKGDRRRTLRRSEDKARYHAEQEKARKLHSLLELGQLIGVDLQLNDMLVQISKKACEVMEADVVVYSSTTPIRRRPRIFYITWQSIRTQGVTCNLVYMVKLKPKRFTIRVRDKDVPIASGMAVTAEIKTGERRVIEFFISPFIKVCRRVVNAELINWERVQISVRQTENCMCSYFSGIF